MLGLGPTTRHHRRHSYKDLEGKAVVVDTTPGAQQAEPGAQAGKAPRSPKQSQAHIRRRQAQLPSAAKEEQAAPPSVMEDKEDKADHLATFR